MEIIRINPNNKQQVHKFLQLPFHLYKDNRQWVPPLWMEARRVFDRDKYHFYRSGEADFYHAQDKQGNPIGRVAVILNRRYNEFNDEKAAFFYLFECENQQEIAQALFRSVFSWAKDQKMNKVIGPKGFTVLDGFGLLVKGFEFRPAFGLPYNYSYYATLLETIGFQRVSDSVSGYLKASIKFPQEILQISETIKSRRGLRVVSFSSRNELRAFLPKLKNLYNSTIVQSEGNYPLEDEEVRALANQFLWFADPRLIKFVVKDYQPVGFLFAYPDISVALQRTAGKIFPFGWILLLLELRRTKWININGAGMIEGHRGLGGTAILFSEMYKSVVESGYQEADIVQIGTENDRMQRELRNLGIDFYKTHRLYQYHL